MVGAVRLEQKFLVHPFDGPVDGERFLEFMDRLTPTLAQGDVVIMDNCRIHHIEAVGQKLQVVGARALYLPPYTPELNPIEEVWSLTKRVLKSLRPRNIVEYVTALSQAALLVTQEKIHGYFRHAESFLTQNLAHIE
jgi:transposase